MLSKRDDDFIVSSYGTIYVITVCHEDIYGRYAALKKVTMITSPHTLTLSSLRWKGLHFVLSRINKLNRDFFHWRFFSLVCPLRNHVTIAFIPSVLERVQRWRVSWVRSITHVRTEKSKLSGLSVEVCTHLVCLLSFWPLHLPFYQRQQNRDHNTNL